MSELKKIDFGNLPKFDFVPQDVVQSINADMKANLQSVNNTLAASQRERERIENEQHENIRRIAENSEDTVNALKKTNELLEENNELLKRENEYLAHRLNDIQLILLNLFSVEVDNGKDQAELMKQAIELASKIDMSITATGKFDWKGVAADTTITGAFMALQVYLHSKGIM